MFFSANELYDYFKHDCHMRDGQEWDWFEVKFNKTNVRKLLAAVRKGIVDRHSAIDFGNECVDLYKWLRPWDVVPKLRNFTPPEGDYGIGVEVEMGFNSEDDASFIANKIKNWKYVAIDVEGGSWPIEATFAPVLYSKLSSKTQVFRYLKLLTQHSDKVHKHDEAHMVGTHINVSKGGAGYAAESRRRRMYFALLSQMISVPTYERDCQDLGNNPLTRDECYKYFNRIPYGGCYSRSTHIEYKLFNSTTDVKALRRYINIAVSLTDLLYSTDPINHDSVRAALEAGYNKR